MKATRQAPLGASHTLAERLNTLMGDLQTDMRRWKMLVEMYGHPSSPDPERQQKLQAILRILDKNPRFQPFRDRLRIFGSMARGNPHAGDVDIMLDYSDLSYERAIRLPDIDLFLALARKYYGLVDVFIQTERWMAVRNDRASGWDIAKGARSMLKAARTEGKSLDQVLQSWPGTVQEARETVGAAQPSTVDQLVTWGEGIGVYATVFERPDSIELDRIDRAQEAPKGRGAEFIRALCAYADKHRKPLYGTVTGGNEQLEDYYRRFGFAPDEATRDDETDDVVVVRQPR